MTCNPGMVLRVRPIAKAWRTPPSHERASLFWPRNTTLHGMLSLYYPTGSCVGRPVRRGNTIEHGARRMYSRAGRTLCDCWSRQIFDVHVHERMYMDDTYTCPRHMIIPPFTSSLYEVSPTGKIAAYRLVVLNTPDSAERGRLRHCAPKTAQLARPLMR